MLGLRTGGSLIPPSYLPYLANAMAAFTVIPIMIGTVSLVNPALSLEKSEFKEPKADHHLVHGLLQLYGSRSLSIGISTLILWYSNRLGHTTYSTLGASFLLYSFFVGVDGWVIEDVTSESKWGHWKFIPALGGIALGLLGVL